MNAERCGNRTMGHDWRTSRVNLRDGKERLICLECGATKDRRKPYGRRRWTNPLYPKAERDELIALAIKMRKNMAGFEEQVLGERLLGLKLIRRHLGRLIKLADCLAGGGVGASIAGGLLVLTEQFQEQVEDTEARYHRAVRLHL